MKALLLSAGLGTRLRPFTEKHPKALAEVDGRTLLEINIRNLQRFGITELVVNVHHFAEQIIHLLAREKGFGSKVHLSDERGQLLETGGGLKKAAKFFEDETQILVMNVDILTELNFTQMVQIHSRSGAEVTLAVQNRASNRYLLFDERGRLRAWKNEQTGAVRNPGQKEISSLRPFAFSGVQIVENDFLRSIGREGSFSLIDVYLERCLDSRIRAWDHSGDWLLDVGKPESLEEANRVFRQTALRYI